MVRKSGLCGMEMDKHKKSSWLKNRLHIQFILVVESGVSAFREYRTVVLLPDISVHSPLSVTNLCLFEAYVHQSCSWNLFKVLLINVCLVSRSVYVIPSPEVFQLWWCASAGLFTCSFWFLLGFCLRPAAAVDALQAVLSACMVWLAMSQPAGPSQGSSFPPSEHRMDCEG